MLSLCASIAGAARTIAEFRDLGCSRAACRLSHLRERTQTERERESARAHTRTSNEWGVGKRAGRGGGDAESVPAACRVHLSPISWTRVVVVGCR